MAVYQNEKNGKWHFVFQIAGKRYHRACKGCTTKRDAERFEREQYRILSGVAAEVAKIETTDALFEARRREITGNDAVLLVDAFEKAMRKPRKKSMSPKQQTSKQSAFADFIAFMAGNYPDVTDAAAVTKKHAEEYIGYIQRNGRYLVRNTYTRGGKTIERATRKIITSDESGVSTATEASTIPSGRTLKFFLTTCAEIFELLKEETGISRNPFSGIKIPGLNPEAREAFSDEELKLIYANLDDFTRPLFITAVFTGLREGDICTLRWENIDLVGMILRHKQRKTGNFVEIPIAEELFQLMLSRRTASDAEYVYPELAEMYLNNASGVSYRVKKFLENLGIKTTKIPEGRSRAVSVKDLHSCRHTFCYYAGLAGVPLATVQAIVGHMTPEMTKRYMAHTTIKDKRLGIDALSGKMAAALGCSGAVENDEPERLELVEIARTADIETVREILRIANCNKNFR